jgi:ABC-type uncharacterized transport system substrate-binding protein
MMRRKFVTLLGGAAVTWALAARAQPPAMPVLGFLGLGPASTQAGRVAALRAGLRDLGYIEGKNIAIEFRWAESEDQLRDLAADLVRIKVDVMFAPSSTFVEAARQATKTIPIVFSNHADPVGLGHVASLAHPGGNITGLSMLLTELAAKDLEIFTEAMPQARRIGVLWNPATPSHPLAVKSVTAAGEKLGVALHMMPVRSAEDFDRVFAEMAAERVDGFLDIDSPLTVARRTALAEIALKHRLAGIFGLKIFVQAGGLISYGADFNDLHRRAAAYIDKILKGANPADLPVEQASKYELVINLKTAKALGIEMPPTLLARADEVIE